MSKMTPGLWLSRDGEFHAGSHPLTTPMKPLCSPSVPGRSEVRVRGTEKRMSR